MSYKTLDALPRCDFVKAYRHFRPVPSNINQHTTMKLSLPWLHLKSFISNFLTSQSEFAFGLSPSLGSYVISSNNPKLVFHTLIYASVEENKYVVHFKRESGDIFAIIKIVDKMKSALLLENETQKDKLECDAKDSNMRFYFNELDEEIKEESS
jgi:hypothetical protein